MTAAYYETLSYKDGGEGSWPIVCINVDDISWHSLPISDDLLGQPENAAFAIMEAWQKLPEFQDDWPYDPDWREDYSLTLHGDEQQRMAVWTPYRGEQVTFVFTCD